MKLAENTHRRLELFFKQYLNDENFELPIINFYVGKFARLLTSAINVHGITFGRRIFITSNLLTLNQNNYLKLPENLVAHEITHVIQYCKEGFLKFFYKYLTSYWRNLREKKKWDADARHEAYLEIPFEIEARVVAAKFVEWSEKLKTKNE